MREEIFIRMKVYDNETPELYERLAGLPDGRIARRTALLRVLHAGFAAIESKTEQVLRDVYTAADVQPVPSMQAQHHFSGAASDTAHVEKPKAVRKTPAVDEVALDAGDLEHLFGGSATGG